MATAYVQASTPGHFVGTTGATSAFGSNVTAGNAILVWIFWSGIADTLSTLTDTLLHVYTILGNPTTVGAGSGTACLAYVLNTAGGANTLTATLSNAQYGCVVAQEVSGAALAAALDKWAINPQVTPGTGTDALTSGAVVTTTAGQYVFGATAEYSFGTPSTSSGTGFTNRIQPDDNGISGHTEDLIQGAAASIAATFTATAGATVDYLTAILTLKAAAGATQALEWQAPKVQLQNHHVTTIVNMRALTPMPVPYLRTTPTRVTNPLDWVTVTPDVVWTDG